MKIKIILISLFLSSFFLFSCYNTKIYVGNVSPRMPLVKVNARWNHHVLYGLIPVYDTNMRAEKYVGDVENYVIKTNISFLNCVCAIITYGLYTPTKTTYLVPLSEVKNVNKNWKERR